MIRRTFRALVRRTPLYHLLRRLRQAWELRRWDRRGRRSNPPPRFKQGVVREYAARFSLEVLVETGTHLGDMVFACRNDFRAIYSLELDGKLFRRAEKRFAGDPHIHVVPGDSYETLSQVLPKISRPCLFWLDAHQTGGGVRGVRITPVAKELRDILASGLEDYVVLIDDARLFDGRADYPTLEEVRELVRARHGGWQLEVRDDIIRAHPGPGPGRGGLPGRRAAIGRNPRGSRGRIPGRVPPGG